MQQLASSFYERCFFASALDSKSKNSETLETSFS